jgi:hypothetical protein
MIVGLGAGVAVSAGNAWVFVMGAVGTGIATTPDGLPLEESALADNAKTRTKLVTRAKLATRRMTHQRMAPRESWMELG